MRHSITVSVMLFHVRGSLLISKALMFSLFSVRINLQAASSHRLAKPVFLIVSVTTFSEIWLFVSLCACFFFSDAEKWHALLSSIQTRDIVVLLCYVLLCAAWILLPKFYIPPRNNEKENQ